MKIDTSQHQHNPKPTPQEILERNALLKRSFLFEQIVERGKDLLFEEIGKEELDYLVNVRKYDTELIKKTEWFYLPEDFDVKTELIQKNDEWKEQAGSLKLQGHFGDNFRLAFPYRNAEGLITGFLKRATDPKGITIKTHDDQVHDNVRWDSTPKLNKDDLFGIDKIENDVDTIVVVEGYPDALYLQALGMGNISAVGQGRLGKKHLEELRRRKIKNVIISFDNDEVGPKNTVEAVKLIFENSNITPYVIDPKSYGNGVKDPDEFLKENGYPMLKNLFDTKAEDGAVWVVKGLVSGYPERSSLEKKEIKENVMDFLSLVKDESTIAEILELIKPIFNETIPSLRKQLKSKRKNYNDELADHTTNDPIIPFLDQNSNTRAYYDARRDVLSLGIDKEFIKELMMDYGLYALESYTSFLVKFDPQDLDGKFDFYSKDF